MDIIKCYGMVSSSRPCMFMSQSLAHDWNFKMNHRITSLLMWEFGTSQFQYFLNEKTDE